MEPNAITDSGNGRPDILVIHAGGNGPKSLKSMQVMDDIRVGIGSELAQ